MNRASASEIADQLLHDLTPVDPTAADALGMEPENVMPALAPAARYGSGRSASAHFER
jgi:hypothetical protein